MIRSFEKHVLAVAVLSLLYWTETFPRDVRAAWQKMQTLWADAHVNDGESV